VYIFLLERPGVGLVGARFCRRFRFERRASLTGEVTYHVRLQGSEVIARQLDDLQRHVQSMSAAAPEMNTFSLDTHYDILFRVSVFASTTIGGHKISILYLFMYGNFYPKRHFFG